MKIALPFIPEGVLFDLDGTLLDREKQIKPGIIEALRELRQRGLKVGICTGRGYAVLYDRVLPYFENEDLHVISGGAEVIWNDGRVIWKQYLESDLVELMFRELNEVGAELFFGQGKNVYLNALKFPRVSPQTKALAKNPLEVGLQDWWAPMIVVDNLSKEVEEKMNEFEQRGLIDEVLVKKMTHLVTDPESISNYYYDVTARGINKGVGLQNWAEEWGIEVNKIVAFGDNANDLEMLETVGWGVAMASGTDEARALADEIIPDVDAGGLEAYLKTILEMML